MTSLACRRLLLDRPRMRRTGGRGADEVAALAGVDGGVAETLGLNGREVRSHDTAATTAADAPAVPAVAGAGIDNDDVIVAAAIPAPAGRITPARPARAVAVAVTIPVPAGIARRRVV